MSNLLQNTMINKLGNDLDNAIKAAGGTTEGVKCIMDYPAAIGQLKKDGVVSNADITVTEGDGIKVTGGELTPDGKKVYTVSLAEKPKEAVLTESITDPFGLNISIPAGTSIEAAIRQVISEILPKSPKLCTDGQDNALIQADASGKDIYSVKNYYEGIKNGLQANEWYLRLCPAVKDGEPIYINVDSLVKSQSESADDAVAEIRQALANLNADMRSIRDQLNSKLDANALAPYEKTADVDRKVNALDSRITATDNKVGSLDSRITALESTKPEAGISPEDLAAIDKKIDAKADKSDISKINAALEEIKEDIANTTNVDALNRRVGQLETDIRDKASQADVTKLNGKVARIETGLESKVEASELATQLDKYVLKETYNTDITALRTKDASLEDKKLDKGVFETHEAAINNRLSGIDNTLLQKANQSSVDSINGEIGTINGKIDTKADKVALNDKADKTTVNQALNGKADKGTVDTIQQDFNTHKQEFNTVQQNVTEQATHIQNMQKEIVTIKETTKTATIDDANDDFNGLITVK